MLHVNRHVTSQHADSGQLANPREVAGTTTTSE
jgi:hypothetical protein